MLKTFNARVHRTSGSLYIGQVNETNETLARCAALSKYGIPDDEDTDPTRRYIRLEDDFDVSPA